MLAIAIDLIFAYLMTSPMFEMLFLFRTLDDFFAYFAFCCVPEAGDCMGGCLITWYHVFAVRTLNIVFAVFILCRVEACPIVGSSSLAHRHKLLLSPKHFWGALSINVQDLHFIKRWITDSTSIFGLLLLLALLWIHKSQLGHRIAVANTYRCSQVRMQSMVAHALTSGYFLGLWFFRAACSSTI